MRKLAILLPVAALLCQVIGMMDTTEVSNRQLLSQTSFGR